MVYVVDRYKLSYKRPVILASQNHNLEKYVPWLRFIASFFITQFDQLLHSRIRRASPLSSTIIKRNLTPCGACPQILRQAVQNNVLSLIIQLLVVILLATDVGFW